MAFGAPTPGLFYSAALTNGTGQGNDEPQGNLQQVQGDGKMYTLRLVNDFAQTFKVAESVFHFGGTYQSGGVANSGVNNQTPYTAASVQTEARGLTFFTPQAFNPTNAPAVNSNIDRTAIDIEGALAHGPFKIQGDYVQVDYSGSNLSTGADFDRSLKAYYVALGWVISGEHYSDWYREGTFVRPRPRNNFGWGKGTAGACGKPISATARSTAPTSTPPTRRSPDGWAPARAFPTSPRARTRRMRIPSGSSGCPTSIPASCST